MKYGLEKELFIFKNGVIQMVPVDSPLPKDECGYLIEARGEPHKKINEAVFSLMAEEFRIVKLANKLGFDAKDISLVDVTRDFKRQCRREYEKGLLKFQNMYEFVDNRHKQNQVTAAVHISFTKPYYYNDKNGSRNCVNEFFDFIKYVKVLDKAFKDEIREAKRNPGFYEIKHNGRVEYRSLPSDVNLLKIIEVIESIK